MARDYDSQLLESISVRRRRLRDALLFGGQRTRRTWDENAGKIFGSIVLAAVVCAGCVGWSFIADKLAHGKGNSAVSISGSTTINSGTGAAATPW
ncbi:hypothetical protein ACFWIY_17810 [Streptomyces sioyaensis]|uniref:hypothetical protein n=1 Tax=Streptomyces sioyaensis TaxID=67364 RepID=UPI003669243C